MQASTWILHWPHWQLTLLLLGHERQLAPALLSCSKRITRVLLHLIISIIRTHSILALTNDWSRFVFLLAIILHFPNIFHVARWSCFRLREYHGHQVYYAMLCYALCSMLYALCSMRYAMTWHGMVCCATSCNLTCATEWYAISFDAMST